MSATAYPPLLTFRGFAMRTLYIFQLVSKTQAHARSIMPSLPRLSCYSLRASFKPPARLLGGRWAKPTMQ